MRIAKQSTAFTVPNVGDNKSSLDEYICLSNISNVSAGDHIGLYEVDANGLVVKFVDIPLDASHIAQAPIELRYPAHYADPVAGSAMGTAQFSGLNLPGGATKWRIGTSAQPPETPVAGSLFNGLDYSAGADIDISGGKNWISLAAVNDSNLVVGFASVPYTEPAPQTDVASLSTLYAGSNSVLTINFSTFLSSLTTANSNLSDLIASIVINPDTSPEQVDLNSSSLAWDPLGVPYPKVMITIPPSNLVAGDVVRVTFKTGALLDSSYNAISQTTCGTTVQ